MIFLKISGHVMEFLAKKTILGKLTQSNPIRIGSRQNFMDFLPKSFLVKLPLILLPIGMGFAKPDFCVFLDI